MKKRTKRYDKLKRIHVNQHKIKANRKNGTTLPVLTSKSYNDNVYGHEIKVLGPCTIVYRPNDPLSCGAHVWIETNSKVVTFERGKGVVGNQ